ncbi:MAG: transposase family protein, partial [Tannerella sp.]|nr:transposase family protein [Tannerella sp.]
MKSPMSYFSNIRDPRVERTREHDLEDIMFIAIASILCGAESWYDMEAFGKASHLVGWAGLRPRNDESAGKIQSHKTLHGNRYLRQMPVEISWSAARSNRSFPGKKFNMLSRRMKSQKALLA